MEEDVRWSERVGVMGIYEGCVRLSSVNGVYGMVLVLLSDHL